MPRRRHHWFAHRPQLFMRHHRRQLSMRHRRRLSSTRRHRHRSFVRHRRSCVHRRHHRWFMHHRPSRLFVRHPQRPTLRRCVESPDYRRAPSRHNQGVRPALKAHWGPLRVDFSPLPRRLRMAAICAQRTTLCALAARSRSSASLTGRASWTPTPISCRICCDRKRGSRASRSAGLVTLPTKERDGPAALEILSSRDCLAPRAHRRGAESAMR